MVYATYGRGSKTGRFVSNTPGTVDSAFTFEPERSTNYEACIKSTRAGGAVVANLSAYHTQVKDQPVEDYLPESSTDPTGHATRRTRTSNAASQHLTHSRK